MAQANGSIEIEVSINGAEAEEGLAKIGAALKDTSKDIEKMGNTVGDTFDELDTGAGKTKKEIKKLSKEGSKDLKKLDKAATDLKGLDSLKDSTGELDSSLKGLGGAIGLVSPEAEQLLFVTGELSGGMEAASRLAKLAGVSMRGLALAGGVLTVALGAVVLVYSQLKAAEERHVALLAQETAGLDAAAASANAYELALINERVAKGSLSTLGAQVERQRLQQTAARLADEAALQEAIQVSSDTAISFSNTEWSLANRNIRIVREANEANAELRATESRTLTARVEAAEAAGEIALQVAADALTAQTATERLAATESRAAAAAELANLNRAHALTLLQQIDPATATYAGTVNGLNEALEQGLSADIFRASMLQAGIQLEADRAAGIVVTTEAVVEQTNALAHLGSMQDLLDSQQLDRDDAATKSAEDMASAKGTALQGMFALSSQLAGDDAEKQKALAIAQTTISGLEAGVRAFADLGFPAGAIAAAGIAAMTVANVAAIAGTDTSMHAGGIVGGIGDVGIRAQGGEAVLNREAVAGLGERGVAALNAGGGGSGNITVEMGYKGRIYDRLTIDALRKGGPLSNAMQRSERRGRRGRVGGLV